MMLTGLKGLLALVVLTVTGLAPAAAKTPKAWKVEGKLLGEASGNDIARAKDVSGIACAPGDSLPRLCLIVDDETQGAQIVLLNKDSLTASDFIRLIDAQFAGEPLELDAEAVAFDKDSFYVVGSHGRARHDEGDAAQKQENIAKAEATRFIFRIGLQASQVDMTTGEFRDRPVISPPATLSNILQQVPEIAAAYDRPLAQNGLTIEGIAVRDNKLYVGMRGPVIGEQAAVVSVAIAAVFAGAPAAPQLLRLTLGTDKRGQARGIRDIVRHGDGFLVLAGPVNDPRNGEVEDGDYAIYPWDGTTPPNRRADLQSFGKKVKPEALIPLSGDARRASVLLMFDGPKEGAPTPLTLDFK